MAGVGVGKALVIEVVDEARDRVALLVLALDPGVGAHRGLDGQRVLPQGVGGGPLAKQFPGRLTGGLVHRGLAHRRLP